MKLHSLKKPPSRLLLNIEEINSSLEQISAGLGGMEQAINTLHSEHVTSNRALEAVIELLGEEPVFKKIQEIRLRRIDQEAAGAIALVDERIKAGILTPVETVGEDAEVVVLAFTSDNGEENHPARSAYPVAELLPEMRAAITGKPVGEKVGIPQRDGYYAEIVGVYTAVEPVQVPTPLAVGSETATPPAATA